MSSKQIPFAEQFKKLEEVEEEIDKLVSLIYSHYPSYTGELSQASVRYKLIKNKAPRMLRELFLDLGQLVEIIEGEGDPTNLIQGPVQNRIKEIESLIEDVIGYNQLLLNTQKQLKAQPPPSLPNNEFSINLFDISNIFFSSVTFELSLVGITLFIFKLMFKVIEMKKNHEDNESIENYWKKELEKSDAFFGDKKKNEQDVQTITNIATDLQILVRKGTSYDQCRKSADHLIEVSKGLLRQIYEASLGTSQLFQIKWQISDYLLHERLNLVAVRAHTTKKQSQEFNWDSINVSQWLAENGFQSLVEIALQNQWDGSSLHALYDAYKDGSSNLGFICEEINVPKGNTRIKLLQKIKEKFSN